MMALSHTLWKHEMIGPMNIEMLKAKRSKPFYFLFRLTATLQNSEKSSVKGRRTDEKVNTGLIFGSMGNYSEGGIQPSLRGWNVWARIRG